MDVKAGDAKACDFCRKTPARRYKFRGNDRELLHYRNYLPPESVKTGNYYMDLCDEHAGKLLQHLLNDLDLGHSTKVVTKLLLLKGKGVPSLDNWKEPWPEIGGD